MPRLECEMKLLVTLTIAAFAVAALRFMPGTLPSSITDFFGGMGIGFAIGATVVWLGQRTPSS